MNRCRALALSASFSGNYYGCSSRYPALFPNVQHNSDLQLNSSNHHEWSSRAVTSTTGTGLSVSMDELDNEPRPGRRTTSVSFPIKEKHEATLCLTVDSLNQAISCYEAEGRLDDALKVWSSFNEIGVLPNMTSYGILIRIFQQQADASNVLGLYKKAKQQFIGIEAHASILEQLQELVRGFCLERINKGLESHESIYEMQGLFEAMLEAELPLCKFVCRGLLLKCGKGKDDHIFMGCLYRYMREKRMLTTSLCNYCIKVLGSHSKFWAALQVYEQMMVDGPRPDEHSRSLMRLQFGRLLNEAKRKNLWKLSIQLIGKMLERKLAPGKLDWEAALMTCAKAGRTEETVILFDKMVTSKCKPDQRAFGALLSAFEKQGRIQDMERVVEAMQRTGVPFSEWIFTTLITGYGKAGNMDAASKVVADMEAAGVQLSVVTYNALVTACARTGDAEGALEWVSRMGSVGIQGNETTFNKLVETLAKGGMWKKAVLTYVQMKNLGLQPSPWAYDAVVTACKSSNVRVQQKLMGFRPKQLRPNVKYIHL